MRLMRVVSSLDNGNGVSRTSSVSTKDKSNLGRRGKNERRRRDSGSFESRNSYAVFYPPPQQSAWPGQPQYVPIATPQQPYPTQVAPVYVPPGPNYPAMMPNAGYPPTYNNMQQVGDPPKCRLLRCGANLILVSSAADSAALSTRL